MSGARAEVSHYARTLEAPTNQAETALTRVEQPSQELTDPDREAFELLKIERDALAEAWKMLKTDLQKQGKNGSVIGPVPETFGSVVQEAQNARAVMNERKRLGGGKPKDYYNKFCQSAYQHRTVFEIFPSSNEYTEIFCGSIITLVKASVNYIQISEGLSRALDEITELADFSKREVDMITNPHTQRGLARLYKEIFLYLKDCTDWFTLKSRKRALKSFNEDFYKCFEDRMQCIKDVASTIHQETMIGGMRDLQKRLASSESLEKERRRRFEQEMSLWRQEMQQLREATFQHKMLEAFEEKVLKMLERESGLRAKYMLEDIWRSNEWERALDRRLQPHILMAGTPPLEAQQEMSDRVRPQLALEAPYTGKQGYKRSEIWDSSSRLETFILGNSVDLINTLPPSPFASTHIAIKLREWLGSRASVKLWIRGSPVAQYPTELSALTGSLIRVALDSKTPILFHFCEPVQSSEVPTRSTVEEAGAVSLVFSLIRQLISLLEPDFTTTVDLSSNRFLPLEDPLNNWKDILRLLEDLFAFSPGVLLCVIDGIDYLDYGRGKPKCADILALLKRREFLSAKEGFVLKALFTSAGYSRTLDDGLGIDEVVIDEGSGRASSGTPGPGQKLIFDDTM